jgi:hypothetical protein
VLSPRVKEHCIARGFSWADSLAISACKEQEYYEDLLRFYRYNYRVSGKLVLAFRRSPFRLCQRTEYSKMLGRDAAC